MRSFWFDPYLWVHLAGIAAVPIFLELCLLGLAIGEPLFPAWLELLFVGGIGILLIFWMQWQRPFSIFSLLVLALKPSQLTDDQRRILQLFKSPVDRVLALLAAVLMGWVLWQLYRIAPASPLLFPSMGRGTGLLVAAIAFLGSNLFLQVPISVLAVMLTSDHKFAATPPYPVEQIPQAFTIPGIRVPKLLPPLVAPSPKPAVAATNTPPPLAEPPMPAKPVQSVTENPIPSSTDASLTSVEVSEEEVIPAEFDDFEEAITAEVEVTIEAVKAATPAETVEPQSSETVESVSVEAIAPPNLQAFNPVILDESRDLTEEIVVPEPQAEGIAGPPTAAPNLTKMGMEADLEAEGAIGASARQGDPAQPEVRAVEATENAIEAALTKPVEIVEDTTVAETFEQEEPEENQKEEPQQGAD